MGYSGRITGKQTIGYTADGVSSATVIPGTRLEHAGNGLNVFEFQFTGFATAPDCKIRLMDSEDGVNFNDALDADGNVIEVTFAPSTSPVSKIRLSGFVASYIQWKYVPGTTQNGTIDTCLYLFA